MRSATATYRWEAVFALAEAGMRPAAMRPTSVPTTIALPMMLPLPAPQVAASRSLGSGLCRQSDAPAAAPMSTGSPKQGSGPSKSHPGSAS